MMVLRAFPYGEASMAFFEENDSQAIKETVLNCVLIMVIMWFVQFLFQFLPRWYLFCFSATFINQLRSKIFRSVVRQPLEFFEKQNTSGNITSILACDVKAINNATIDFVIMLFNGVSLTIFAIILCSFIFVWFSIISLAMMPLIIFGLL